MWVPKLLYVYLYKYAQIRGRGGGAYDGQLKCSVILKKKSANVVEMICGKEGRKVIRAFQITFLAVFFPFLKSPDLSFLYWLRCCLFRNNSEYVKKCAHCTVYHNWGRPE